MPEMCYVTLIAIVTRRHQIRVEFMQQRDVVVFDLGNRFAVRYNFRPKTLQRLFRQLAMMSRLAPLLAHQSEKGPDADEGDFQQQLQDVRPVGLVDLGNVDIRHGVILAERTDLPIRV